MGGVLSKPSSKKAERKAEAAVEAAERKAKKAEEEERAKEIERRRRGRAGMINTSLQGLIDDNVKLQRKNLLGE